MALSEYPCSLSIFWILAVSFMALSSLQHCDFRAHEIESVSRSHSHLIGFVNKSNTKIIKELKTLKRCPPFSILKALLQVALLQAVLQALQAVQAVQALPLEFLLPSISR